MGVSPPAQFADGDIVSSACARLRHCRLELEVTAENVMLNIRWRTAVR